MATGKLRKAIGAVKDRTSIGLIKVGSSTPIPDLEVAIVKATRHEEYPPDERYVQEILNLTTCSRAFVGACVRTIARRLNRTKNWVVALKAVMLIQRLLAEGDIAYEQEIFFVTRRGTRLLNLSEFRDASGRSSYVWEFEAFVRTYARYLDEKLEMRMQGRRGKRSAYGYRLDEDKDGRLSRTTPAPGTSTPLLEMNTESLVAKVHRLLQLLDRFLACRPTGAARDHRIVIVALYPIVKENFRLYYEIAEILGLLIDRFPNLDPSLMVKVHDIFSRAAKQFDELDAFYAWAKTIGITRSSEYPEVDKIAQKKLDMMGEFIRDKSMANRFPAPEPEPEREPDPEPEEDANAIKALPPPQEEVSEEHEEEIREVLEIPYEELKKVQDEGDLINLGEDTPTTEENSHHLALALFNDMPTETTSDSGPTPWEAFDDSEDWETALVQSASYLLNQKASLPGGFDTLTLDGMYQQEAIAQSMLASGILATGSASSIALGSAGRPAMLALPAPDGMSDPFAASLAIAPPAYVVMSEMEEKQRLLVEEQVMWQQYQQDGIVGQISLAKVQQNPFHYA